MTTATTYRVVVPVALPAALSANSRRRGNHWSQREATDTLKQAATLKIREQWCGAPLIRGPVMASVHIHWPSTRKGRMPDLDTVGSFTKAVIDSLEGEVLENDRQIERVTFTQSKLTKQETLTMWPDGAVVIDLERRQEAGAE